MQYSPKLKIAMGEIKQILLKHDIAAFVVLHAPSFCEYLNHVSPSYSCAKLEPDGIRVRLKESEVGGKEQAKFFADNTMNMIQHFSLQIGKHALLYIDAEEMLKEYWPSDNTPGEHTGHEQQNN